MTEFDFDFDAEYGAAYERTARQMAPARDTSYALAWLLLKHALPEQARVLIVGTGTGKELATFGAAQPSWTFTGVETSSQMVGLTRETLRGAGLEGRTELVEGQVHDLPNDPAFDAATLLYVLHFLPDDAAKLELLSAVAARLRPGALLVVGQHQALADPAESAFFQSAWEDFMAQQGMTAEERAAFLGRCRASLFPITDAKLGELVVEAGFGPPAPFFRALFQGFWIARKPA